MKIAIEGCAHGELEKIYDVLQLIQETEKIKIDLLLCCGDFQSTRNENDLRCMAVPPKFYNMCSFYKYYSGEKLAPILTIFIGGNHEASNYLQELPYGGWVAPNIYYLGYAGVVNVGGIRIAGISGIYKSNHFVRGHNERVPYSEDTKRSVYHVRNLEVFRLKQLSDPIDIFLSHDWPKDITNYGNKTALLKRKPFFQHDIESGKLGSPLNEELLTDLKPKYWFAAHLHCKFAAVVPHSDGSKTKFLALDKCLPRRNYLQIVDVQTDDSQPTDCIQYDLEWLTILFHTNHLLSVKSCNNYMPSATGNDRHNFRPTDEEKSFVLQKFESLTVPENFEKTADSYNPNPKIKTKIKQPSEPKLNPQTVQFCQLLGVDDPVSLLCEMHNTSLSSYENSDKTECSSDDVSVSFSSDRTSLVLPEPVSDTSELLTDSFCETIRSTLEEEAIVSSSDQKEEKLPEQTDNTPAVKKFKRRNASIYQNDE